MVKERKNIFRQTDDQDARWTRLHEIIETMEIPHQRKNDIHWLKRNLPFNNSNHQDFDEAWRLISEIRQDILKWTKS